MCPYMLEHFKNHLKTYRRSYLIGIPSAFLVLAALIISIKVVFALDVVDLYFSPASADIPPNQPISLMLDAKTQQIGFVHVEMTFDPTLVNLTDEVTTTNFLKTIVQKTSIVNANTTGRIILVLALSPEDVASPPTGLFELANLPFGSVTSQENVQATLTIDSPTVQVVDMSETNLSFTTNLATFNLNPTLTPTPTQSPTSTPTQFPSETPTPISVPTAIPTQEVTATPTVTPLPSPSPTPPASPTPIPEEATLTFVGNPPAYVGENFPVKIHLSTSAIISGVDAVILFNPDKLNVQNIDDSHLLDTTTTASFDNTNGIIRLSQVENPGGGFEGSGDMAQINFQGVAPGSDVLLFQYTPGSAADSNAIRLADGEDILTQPLPLAFDIIEKVRLSLVFSTPSRLGFDYSGTLSQVNGSFTTVFTSDVNGQAGNWELDNTLNGQTVTYSIKVAGFLKKNSQITLAGGDNEIDFGSLLAGDNNDDGIINNIDLSIMYADWSGSGISDYNRDGIVNSADHWHIMQNFLKVDD